MLFRAAKHVGRGEAYVSRNRSHDRRSLDQEEKLGSVDVAASALDRRSRSDTVWYGSRA